MSKKDDTIGKEKTPEDIKEPTTEKQEEKIADINEHLASYTEDPETEQEKVDLGINDDYQPPEPPKKKRGRPKGSTSKKSSDRFTENVEGSEIINGALMLMFIDTALPMLISVINNKFSKEGVKPTQLKLNAGQKRELEPLANEVAKQIAIKGNPLTVLIISMIAIYGGNYLLAKSE